MPMPPKIFYIFFLIVLSFLIIYFYYRILYYTILSELIYWDAFIVESIYSCIKTLKLKVSGMFHK